MQLDEKDIESVAKSRVSRGEKQKTNYYVWGMIVGMAIGFILAWKVSVLAGYAVVVLSIIAFFYYNSKLSKKQKVYSDQLIAEWRREQEKTAKIGG